MNIEIVAEVATIVTAGAVLLIGSRAVPRLRRSVGLARHEFAVSRANARGDSSATSGTETD